MDKEQLHSIAKQLVAKGKGILAIDESTNTAGKRLATIGLENTEQNRQAYRQLLVTTKGLGQYISGAILFDETLRQSTDDGKSFVDCLKAEGILPGIKVDTGAKDFEGHPGEKLTQGLDGLRDRLKEYVSLGAVFCKWRAVITIGDGIPTTDCLVANADALADYALACQAEGLVPIVEPEVLMGGKHSIERCYEVTGDALKTVFETLKEKGVYLGGMILKPNMIIAGADAKPVDPVTVADMTVECLEVTVPADVCGIAFLSGGQSDDDATNHLNKMNKKYPQLPWPLTFSYGRSLQTKALQTWKGDKGKVATAQAALLKRAHENAAASKGEYKA